MFFVGDVVALEDHIVGTPTADYTRGGRRIVTFGFVGGRGHRMGLIPGSDCVAVFPVGKFVVVVV
jgi:hypothetical protein